MSWCEARKILPAVLMHSAAQAKGPQDEEEMMHEISKTESIGHSEYVYRK